MQKKVPSAPRKSAAPQPPRQSPPWLLLVIWLGVPRLPGAIELAAVDVGQGLSFAALTDNAAVVIDCGSIGSPVNAGDATADYLASYGRSRVDLLVLTHFHADHANGVARLMRRVDVARVAYPTDCEHSEYMDEILALGEETGAQLLPVYIGGKKRLFGSVRVVFGTPYRAETASRRATAEEYQTFADQTLKRIYALGGLDIT